MGHQSSMPMLARTGSIIISINVGVKAEAAVAVVNDGF
jgi:hypothetical protein